MDDSPAALTQQAIAAALSANWEEALKLNQQIINIDPKNTEALNRLGRASFELGNLKNSKKYFEEVLKIDPYNQIASKFLKKINAFSKRGSKKAVSKKVLPSKELTAENISQINIDSFIEEPGKTKHISLLKVAEPQKLSLLSPGLPVNLVKKNHCISVTDQNGEYLGVLPDDLSHHLLRLISGGNKYQAYIKTVKTNGLSILIQEVFRSAKFRNQPSFLDSLATSAGGYSTSIFLSDDNEEEPPFEENEEEIT